MFGFNSPRAVIATRPSGSRRGVADAADRPGRLVVKTQNHTLLEQPANPEETGRSMAIRLQKNDITRPSLPKEIN